MNGFVEMVEASQRSASSELNNPPDVEEQHRETYPDICTPECEHVTCGYRTEENRGRPCFMKWKQSETPPQPQSDPLARTPLLRKIEEEVEKAFKPITDRLEAIENRENTEPSVQRMLEPNGQQRRRIDIGTNSERINHD